MNNFMNILKEYTELPASSIFMRLNQSPRKSIILNLSEEGEHGCNYNCSYCSHKKSIPHRRIAPTMTEVTKFLNGYSGLIVTISGGGDPLYRYGISPRNTEYINGLIKHIKMLGYVPEIITKNYKLVLDEYSVLYKNLVKTAWLLPLISLSFDYWDDNEELFKKLKALSQSDSNKLSIRLSTVVDSDRNCDTLENYITGVVTPINKLLDAIIYDRDINWLVSQIFIREDSRPITHKWYSVELPTKLFATICNPSKVHFLSFTNCCNGLDLLQ